MPTFNIELSTEEICDLVELLEEELETLAECMQADSKHTVHYKREHVRMSTLYEKLNKVL